VLPSGQKVTLGLLATIVLELVHFRAYASFLALLPFLNTSWKSCSVRVFTTSCDYASITSIVSYNCCTDGSINAGNYGYPSYSLGRTKENHEETIQDKEFPRRTKQIAY
jgi:hypothetical protein